MNGQPDELLTVKEAARILKVSPYTVYRWIADGRLAAVRYSRRVVRVRRSDLERAGYAGRRDAELRRLNEVAVPEYGTAGQSTSEKEVLDVEGELAEVRRLFEYYRELQRRPRDPNDPPRGSWEALRRSVGVISQEEGDELYRVVMEERKKERERSRSHPEPPIF